MSDQVQEKQNRQTAFDAFRGLAIILVVFAHATGYGWGYRGEAGGALNFYWSLVLRNFAFFCLPLFLVISGYWLANVSMQNTTDYFLFLRKRFSRIALPYLFWSVFFLLLAALRTRSLDPQDFLLKILLGKADGPYYFIHLMLQFYLLTPLFLWGSRNKERLSLLLIAHITALGALYVYRYYYNPSMSYVAVKLPFWAWTFFFPLGMYIRHHPTTGQQLSTLALCLMSIVFGLLATLESEVLFRYSAREFAISDIRFPPFAYSLSCIFLILRTRQWAWPAWLIALGQYAFGVFFIHGFFLRAAAKLFAKLPHLVEFQPLFQTAIALTSLGLSCVVIYVTRRILGKRISANYLGF